MYKLIDSMGESLRSTTVDITNTMIIKTKRGMYARDGSDEAGVPIFRAARMLVLR